jgi:N utilization substance protein B
MGARRVAREVALQALYQLDMRGEPAEPGDLGLFWSHFDCPEDAGAFARELVEGVRGQQSRIDELIKGSVEHWRLERLSGVDRNLLRVATFELVDRPEIPTSVTINEAVEIARRYGSEDSAAFVNGVLDHIAGVLGLKAEAKSSG